VRGAGAQPLGPWRLRKPNPPKLDAHIAAQIRRLNREGVTQWRLAQIFSVSYSTVQSICCGRRWAVNNSRQSVARGKS